MKKYIFAGLGILAILVVIVIAGNNGLTGKVISKQNQLTSSPNFEQICKDNGHPWMKMEPMKDGRFTSNSACFGCMPDEKNHICNLEEYLNFGEFTEEITGNAIKEINTPQNLETVNLQFEGMDCPSCALGVEYELKQVNGVVDARVKYPEGTGTVTFDSAVVDAETIAEASTAYPAKVVSKSK